MSGQPKPDLQRSQAHRGPQGATIRVRATRRGHIYDLTRDPGDEFDCALTDLAVRGPLAWMEPASEADREALRDLSRHRAKYRRDQAQRKVADAARLVSECKAALKAAELAHAEAIVKLELAGGPAA
jgi:hypothetical protein